MFYYISQIYTLGIAFLRPFIIQIEKDTSEKDREVQEPPSDDQEKSEREIGLENELKSLKVVCGVYAITQIGILSIGIFSTLCILLQIIVTTLYLRHGQTGILDYYRVFLDKGIPMMTKKLQEAQLILLDCYTKLKSKNN